MFVLVIFTAHIFPIDKLGTVLKVSLQHLAQRKRPISDLNVFNHITFKYYPVCMIYWHYDVNYPTVAPKIPQQCLSLKTHIHKLTVTLS